MARRDFEKAQEDDVKEGQAIATIGDGSSRAEFVPDDMDWGRCARFTLIGTVLVGPALHTWYGFLIRKFPDTALGTVVKRVTLDQLAFAPVFLATFLSSIMVLDGNAAKVLSSNYRSQHLICCCGDDQDYCGKGETSHAILSSVCVQDVAFAKESVNIFSSRVYLGAETALMLSLPT